MRWKNKGVVKIGKCDRNIVLWNLNWIKKKKPEDKRRLLDNEKIDSPWARKS